MKKVFNTVRNLDAHRLQLDYMNAFDRVLTEQHPILQVSDHFHLQIADAYDCMQHDPFHPETVKAYAALVLETKLQFIYIQHAGYSIELLFDEGEPYKSSNDMITDLILNKHLWILPTSQDFGNNDITPEQRDTNMMLQNSGQTDANGIPMLNNDLFRAVHDFFGHSVMGNGFGAIGEENAYREHVKMYSHEARKAMTVETRGQNSWVNFGEHMRTETGELRSKSDPLYLPASKRPFAPQKIGLLPAWCLDLYQTA